MCLGVGGIVKLAQYHRAGDFVAEPVGLSNAAAHALGARGQYELGAVGRQQLATLYAHGLGHREDEVITLHGRYPCQAYAGIAAGGLDDGGSRREQFRCLGCLDHGQGDTVFHAAAGIETLDFGQQTCVQVLGRLYIAQLQQRGVTDELGNTCVYS